MEKASFVVVPRTTARRRCRPGRAVSALVIGSALSVLLTSRVTAQRGPAPDPLVNADALVKVADHTYVIPDANVPLVPNVGIVVGTRATLVIDPGLGRRNGETILRAARKLSHEQRAVHRVNPLPPGTHDWIRRVPGDGEVRQLQDAGIGVRGERGRHDQGLLGPLRADRRTAVGRGPAARRRYVRSRLHAGSRRRPRAVSPRRDPPIRAATPGSSSRATACSSPATS